MSKAAAGKGAAAEAGKGDEAAAAASAAAAAAEAGKGDDAAAKGAAAGADAGAGEKTYTKAELDRELAKQKKEHDKAVEAEAAKAKLSEDEKKDATIKELQQTIRMRDAKDEVVAALEKAGAKATGLMWNAIKGDLEFDDKGKLTNLKDLVKELQAEYADQFGEPKPEGTVEGGAGQQTGGGSGLTKEKLATMSASDIKALDWEEVKKVMAQK